MTNIQIEPGTFIDDFIRVDGVIGRGGMGLVYKATHMALDRQLALKVTDNIRALDKRSINRFKREAFALSSLSHPNIVSFYKYGLWLGTIPYIAMEFLDGTALDQRLQHAEIFPAERIKHIMLQSTDALIAAHNCNITHRDLKPSNIMLVDEPKKDTVKILDFGLAHLSSEKLKESQKLTRTGTLVGTVSYMSPEQCRGEKSDQRSDIYSLGCIIYELLTGAPPFSGDTAYAIMHKHLNSTPPLIESAVLAKGIEYKNLAGIANKCMAKNPAERYQKMPALQNDLRNISEELAFSSAKSQAISQYRNALLATLVAATITLVIVYQDNWLIPLKARAIENSTDKNEWRSALAEAIKLKESGKKTAALQLMEAALVSARRNKATSLSAAIIKSELSQLMLDLNAKVEARNYGVQALRDFATAVNTISVFDLEKENFMGRLQSTVTVLLQLPKDRDILTATSQLSYFLRFHKAPSLQLLIAKLNVAAAMESGMEGKKEIAQQEINLASSYLEVHMYKEAKKELSQTIRRALSIPDCTIGARALSLYAKGMSSDERKTQADELLGTAKQLEAIYSVDKNTEGVYFRIGFLADMARFYFYLGKIAYARKLMLQIDGDFPSLAKNSDDILLAWPVERNIAEAWALIGDKEGIKRSISQTTLLLNRLPESYSRYRFNSIIAQTNFLLDHGFKDEAAQEFDEFINDHYSEAGDSGIEEFIYSACVLDDKPSQALYYEDRIINLCKQNAIKANVLVAMQAPTVTLLRLERKDESIAAMIKLLDLHLAKSPADWNFVSQQILFHLELSLLDNGQVEKAERILDDFKPPETILDNNIIPGKMIAWSRILIAGRQGNEDKLKALITILDSKQTSDWSKLAKADLDITKGRFQEANKILSEFRDRPPTSLPWETPSYAGSLRQRLEAVQAK